MRKNILIMFCFSFISCSSQLKINKGKDVDILLDVPQKQSTNNNYLIRNNSNLTYIIDSFGFYGESTILVDAIPIKPIDLIRGEYYRTTDKQCKDDLIILFPKEERRINLNLTYNTRGVIYDYSKYKAFTIVVKSNHTRNNVITLGCKSYIENLEKKGYRVLEDTIDAKIPFIK